MQPFADTVYLISVVPDEMPLTIPEAFTMATDVFELVQIPPVVIEAKEVVEPGQTFNVPVIGATEGGAVMFISCVLILEHPLAVTV